VRRDDARGDHRQHPIALAARPRADQVRNLQPLHGYANGGHMPVRPRRDRFELFCGRGQPFTAQNGADRFDLRVGQRGEIGDGAFANPSSFAERFTQQIGRARAAVRDDIDMYGCMMGASNPDVKRLHGYIMGP